MNYIKWSELLVEWPRLAANAFYQEVDSTMQDAIVTKIEEKVNVFSYHAIKTFHAQYPEQDMVFSIYAKAGERKMLGLSTMPPNAHSFDVSALFNLEDGSLAEGSGIITDALNGWWRCSVTAKVTDSDMFGVSVAIVTDDGQVDYEGEQGKGLYLTKAQLEKGTVAGVYEETVGFPRS